MARRSLWQKQLALPADHGAWVFLLSPFLIGAGLAPAFTAASGWALLAGLAAFLLRQPVSILVKIRAGRRPRQDWPVAVFWGALYGAVATGAALALLTLGESRLLWLAVPGGLVFGWHLWLVARRAERRQMGVDLVASGALALAAPAAYWAGGGEPMTMGGWLWGLTWLQSAASIVFAFMRLEQRAGPPISEAAATLAERALLYSGFNFGLALGLGLLPGYPFPAGLALPYALQLLETWRGKRQPAYGVPPVRIGLRQLAVSALFTLLFILVWRL